MNTGERVGRAVIGGCEIRCATWDLVTSSMSADLLADTCIRYSITWLYNCQYHMYIGISINITFFLYEINFTREIGLQKTEKIYLPKKMNIFLAKKMNIFSYLYGMSAKCFKKRFKKITFKNYSLKLEKYVWPC